MNPIFAIYKLGFHTLCTRLGTFEVLPALCNRQHGIVSQAVSHVTQSNLGFPLFDILVLFPRITPGWYTNYIGTYNLAFLGAETISMEELVECNKHKIKYSGFYQLIAEPENGGCIRNFCPLADAQESGEGVPVKNLAFHGLVREVIE